MSDISRGLAHCFLIITATCYKPNMSLVTLHNNILRRQFTQLHTLHCGHHVTGKKWRLHSLFNRYVKCKGKFHSKTGQEGPEKEW